MVPTSRQYGFVAVVGGDAAVVERMRRGHAFLHRLRNDVLAEIVARRGVGEIARQRVVQICGVEDVDAHAGQRDVRACPASPADWPASRRNR